MRDAVSIAVELIKRWEGCYLVAYPDPSSNLGRELRRRGVWLRVLRGQVAIPADLLATLDGRPWTIGYGHASGVQRGERWTQTQAETALLNRVTASIAWMRPLFMREPTPSQLGALLSFEHNVGETQFRGSTLLAKFRRGDIAGAAAEFGRWNKSNGKVEPGLINRRADERRVFLS